MTNEMFQDEKIWICESLIPPHAGEDLQMYPRIIRQILYNRGYGGNSEAEKYFSGELGSEFQEANLLGMESAVSRIEYAINHQEAIAVYGDYDVDGVTATALLTLALLAMGAEARPYIPNRFDEGYGLNIEALKSIRDDGSKLVITVDCGIRSHEEVKFANDIGLDMIISDHHHPDDKLPEALAIINPKQAGDMYPEKDLAGVGLAYKLAEALIPHMEASHIDLSDYLDLVALGTVSDLAPLTGENRFLVRKGIDTLRNTKRQGLLSLMMVARINPNKVSATDIGFALGPRLNAAGRLDSALASLDLVLTNDVFEAGMLAQQLDVQNRERQRITRTIQDMAMEMAFKQEDDAYLLFAYHPEFNPGVVGLAASRLSEAYYRPAVVAYFGENETRGSCRSIKEFHITEALDQCKDILIRHGGHAAAAGFTVSNENLQELEYRLKQIAAKQLAGQELRPTLMADVEIPLHELKPELMHYIKLMEPTGYGNRQPHFISRDLFIDRDRTRQVGNDGNHLKLVVTDGLITYDAIAFRQGYWYEKLPRKIDLLYTFEINEFNGRTNFQLNVKDIKPSEIGYR